MPAGTAGKQRGVKELRRALPKSGRELLSAKARGDRRVNGARGTGPTHLQPGSSLRKRRRHVPPAAASCRPPRSVQVRAAELWAARAAPPFPGGAVPPATRGGRVRRASGIFSQFREAWPAPLASFPGSVITSPRSSSAGLPGLPDCHGPAGAAIRRNSDPRRVWLARPDAVRLQQPDPLQLRCAKCYLPHSLVLPLAGQRPAALVSFSIFSRCGQANDL